MSASSLQNFYAPAERAASNPREKFAAAVDCAMRLALRKHFQPWQFLVTPTQIELHADFDQATDPEGREVIVHCGTALFHLRLALKHYGALGKVELFPLLGQPSLLARIHYGASGPVDAEQDALFAAMTGYEKGLPPTAPATLPDLLLEELAAAADHEHVSLERLQSEASRQRLLDCVHEQERVHQSNHPAPLALRLRIGSAGSDPAEPIDRFLCGRTAAARTPLLLRMVRAFDFSRRDATGACVISSPQALAVLKTKADNNSAWLAAGQGMARVRLAAQTRGVSTACLSQAMHESITREMLRTSIGRKGYPQMILRFDFPATTSGIVVPASRPATQLAH